MKKWFKPWHEDSFLSGNGTLLRYDKLEHLILAFIAMAVTSQFISFKNIQVFGLWFLFWNGVGMLWEVFQRLFLKHLMEPKDIAANNAGFVLTLFFYL